MPEEMIGIPTGGCHGPDMRQLRAMLAEAGIRHEEAAWLLRLSRSRLTEILGDLERGGTAPKRLRIGLEALYREVQDRLEDETRAMRERVACLGRDGIE